MAVPRRWQSVRRTTFHGQISSSTLRCFIDRSFRGKEHPLVSSTDVATFRRQLALPAPLCQLRLLATSAPARRAALCWMDGWMKDGRLGQVWRTSVQPSCLTNLNYRNFFYLYIYFFWGGLADCTDFGACDLNGFARVFARTFGEALSKPGSFVIGQCPLSN